MQGEVLPLNASGSVRHTEIHQQDSLVCFRVQHLLYTPTYSVVGIRSNRVVTVLYVQSAQRLGRSYTVTQYCCGQYLCDTQQYLVGFLLHVHSCIEAAYTTVRQVSVIVLIRRSPTELATTGRTVDSSPLLLF